MTARPILALLLAAAVAACGGLRDSALGGLFGRSASVAADTSNPAADPRPLVRQITELRLEKVPGGAIIHATGLPERQGFFGGALLPLNGGVPVNGVLAYQFRVTPPLEATLVGPPRSREIIVGTFVSDQTLAGVRQVQVSAAGNALAVGG